MSKPTDPRMQPPPRLVEDASAAPSLRGDMARAREDHAREIDAYDTAAGLVALQAAIASSAGVGAASSASTSAASSALGKGAAAKVGAGLAGASAAKLSVIAAGGLALVIGAVTFAPSAPSVPVAKRSPQVAAAVAQSAPVAAPATTAPVAAPAAAEPQQPAQAPIAHAMRASAPEAALQARAHAAQPDPNDALRRETEQLARIRSALQAGRAREAYRLAQAGQRTRGQGMLWQEREALAIVALFELDRAGEATQRARALLARFPESAFRAELEERMQGETGAR